MQPQPSFLSLLNPLAPWRTLYRHRDLLWQFTVRNVQVRYKGSALGVAWTVLNPLMMLALYVFVFGYVFGGSFHVLPDETRWDFGLGVFVGLTIFNLVAESITVAPTVVVSNTAFVKRVVVPLETLSPAVVGASLVQLAISLAMVLVGVLVGGRGFTWQILALPLVILPIMAMSVGLSWMISAASVFYRDLGQVMGFVSSALLFASALFYPSASIPPSAWHFLRFNPMIHAVDTARNIVLWQLPLDWGRMAVVYAWGFGLFFVGHAIFCRSKGSFADAL